MCTVCGCAPGETRIEGHHQPHSDDHAHDHAHPHDHSHSHSLLLQKPAAAGPLVVNGLNLHFGQGPARAHAPGLSQSRMLRIEQDILASVGPWR